MCPIDKRARAAVMMISGKGNLKLTFVLLAGLAGLCGCAHEYLMKLSDGDQIISYSKPELQGSGYHFRDSAGIEYVMPKDRVVKIQAVSVVKEEQKPPAPARPTKPRHWYFLWLA